MPLPDSKRHVIRVAVSPRLRQSLLKAANARGQPYGEIVREAIARQLGDKSLAEMGRSGARHYDKD